MQKRLACQKCRGQDRPGSDWGPLTTTSTPNGAVNDPIQNPSYTRDREAAKVGAAECGSQRDDDSVGDQKNPFRTRIIREQVERSPQEDYKLLMDLAETGSNDGSLSVAAQMVGQLTIHNPQPLIQRCWGADAPIGPGHDYGLRSKTMQIPTQMPLIKKSGGRCVYQPFLFTDMGCILDKMANSTDGGGPWMSKFCQLTVGPKLAMGDWRALIGNQYRGLGDSSVRKHSADHFSAR